MTPTQSHVILYCIVREFALYELQEFKKKHGTNFVFYTFEFYHIKVLYFYKVQTETSVIS